METADIDLATKRVQAQLARLHAGPTPPPTETVHAARDRLTAHVATRAILHALRLVTPETLPAALEAATHATSLTPSQNTLLRALANETKGPAT